MNKQLKNLYSIFGFAKTGLQRKLFLDVIRK